MRFLSSTAFWQVAASAIGVVACAVPCAVIHCGFWDYHFAVQRSDTKGVRIEQIQPNTPAAALQEKDRIVAINGQEDAIYDIHKAWRDAPVGSEVEFRVLRGEPLTGDNALPPHPWVTPRDFKPETKKADEVVVRVPRVADQVAARVYWHWQLPAALTFIGLGILAVVFRAFPRASGWGSFLLLVGAVTLLVVLFVVNWKWRLVSQRITLSEHYSYFDPFPWQKAVAVGVCVALALLGIVGCLTALLRRENLRMAEPVAAPDPAGT